MKKTFQDQKVKVAPLSMIVFMVAIFLSGFGFQIAHAKNDVSTLELTRPADSAVVVVSKPAQVVVQDQFGRPLSGVNIVASLSYEKFGITFFVDGGILPKFSPSLKSRAYQEQILGVTDENGFLRIDAQEFVVVRAISKNADISYFVQSTELLVRENGSLSLRFYPTHSCFLHDMQIRNDEEAGPESEMKCTVWVE